MYSHKYLARMIAAAGACCFVAQSTTRAQAQTFKVTEMPTFGGTVSQAFGLNAIGQVTGFALTANSSRHAFVWTPSSPNTTSGSIADLGAGKYTMAFGFGINLSGFVAGSAVNNLGFERAVLYSGGSWSDVVGGSSTHQTDAYSINDAGQVTGTDWTYGAYLSTLVNGKRKVVYIAPAYLFGLTVNKSGQVLVVSGPNHDVAIWTPASPNGATGILTSLGISPGTSRGYLNDKGQVAVDGKIYLPSGDYGMTAGWHSLGALPSLAPQYDSLICYGMNNLGQVVGVQVSATAQNPNGSYVYTDRSFVWDPVNGIRDISSMLDPVTGAGWLFNLDQIWAEPTPNGMAINDAGQIAGTGTHNGLTRGFLLTP